MNKVNELLLAVLVMATMACGSSAPGNDGSVPDASCVGGISQGCACDPADRPVDCYDGPSAALSNPPCTEGLRSCDPGSSTWGPCDGQVLPETEICDMSDNDCDGQVDEGVLSECGDCTVGCNSIAIDLDPFPMPGDDPNIDADGVGLDTSGDLVLDSSTIENHFLWIANMPEGTVSKLDTRTGLEIARYASVSNEVVIDHTGGSPIPAWNEVGANRPSHIAVDFNSDVWVANRALNRQPSLTKILNVVDDCEDRNINGVIETSSDVNGNGVIEISDPLEFFGDSDECIRMTVVVGTVGGRGAHALAIDQGIEPGDPGDAWVGMYTEQAFYEIDGRTGALKQRAPPIGALGTSPFGAAIDSRGRLWAPDGCCGSARLQMINTLTTPATIGSPVAVPDMGGAGSYGITVDTRDRIWLGGWPWGSLKRYDPTTAVTVEVQIPDNFGLGYGVRGVGIDTHGNVWAAIHFDWSDGRVARIDADTAASTGWWNIIGEIPVGVGVDFDGNVWSVNQGTSNVSRLHIDQVGLEPTLHPISGNTVDVYPVGPTPYTYSDFTGLGLRTVTWPNADYVVPIQGCMGGAQATWLAVEWDATTPANSAVEIWVRSGDDLASLDSQPVFGPWTISAADPQSSPGPVPDGAFLQLSIRLFSGDGGSTPVVHGYRVQWTCP